MGVLLSSTDSVFPDHQHPSSMRLAPVARSLHDKLQRSLQVDQAVLDLIMTLMERTKIIMSLRRDTAEMELDPAVVQVRVQIQEAFNNVEIPQPPGPARSDAPVSVALETVCQITASICWRLIEPPSPESEHAQLKELEQLRLALEETNPLDWDGGLEVLLWVVLLAIAADKHGPNRRWFMAHLVALLISLGDSHFLSMANLIRDFI